MKKAGTTELQRIDAAIEEEQATKTTLEAQLASDINTRGEAIVRQQKIAYQALTSLHPESLRQLEDVETTLSKAEQRLLSGQYAVSTCDKKLSQLQQQRTEMFRQEKLREYSTETDALIADGIASEKTLLLLISAKKKLDDRLRTLDGLAVLAGFNNDAPHRNVGKNLRRSLALRLGYNDIWLTTTARQLYSKSVDELMQVVLNNGEAIEERSAAANS